ncbi:MAG: histidine kinase, partial [Myxococcota bacterium]
LDLHLELRRWEIPEEYTRVVQQHHDDAFDESDLLLLVVRLVDQACNKVGVGIRPQPDLNLPTTAEAQALRVPELTLAELEVQIEDLASEAAG